jgi:outer membrane protein assembly factor BamA
LFLLACTPARREVSGIMVRNVQFEGNGGMISGQSDAQLRKQMEQEASGLFPLTWPFMYFSTPATLSMERLSRDAYRLETWYAHQGWFDAKILGWQARRVRARRGEHAGVIDLYARVDPGPSSKISALEVTGLNASNQLLATSVQRNSLARVGETFLLESVEMTRLELLSKLRDHGYPYAEVKAHMVARPLDHEVDVQLEANSGLRSRFGAIRVVGNEHVPQRFIRSRIAFARGDSYKHALLTRTQRELFDLGAFSMVSVDPDLSDSSVDEVPVTLNLAESKFRKIRLGGGFEYNVQQIKPGLSASFRHVNLWSKLIRLDLSTELGLAFDVVSSGPSVPDPTYAVEGRVRYPWLFHPRTSLDLSGGLEQDVQQSLFSFRRPYGEVAAVWGPPARTKGLARQELLVRVGPHVEGFRYLEESEVLVEVTEALNGEDFANPYLLLAIDEFVSYDARDDKVFPTRGSYASLGLRQSVPVGDPGYQYLSAVAEGRRYTKIRIRDQDRVTFPLVLAMKLRGHLVQPLGDSQVPYAEKVFLGGSTSIRGFMTNMVGPYRAVCYDPQLLSDEVTGGAEGCEGYLNGEVDKTIVPVGGRMAVEGSGELRYDWAYGIRFATFVDAGVLVPEPSQLSLDDFRWSTGVGIRYDTPVGPLRVDVAVRPRYEEDSLPGARRRVYDLLSSAREVGRRRGLWGDAGDGAPFALVLFLAIGEAV